jgi:hypothetical protein
MTAHFPSLLSRRAAAAVCGAALLFACTGTLISIDVDGESETTVTRGTILEDLVGSMGFGDFLDMDITSASELENQGVAPGDIQDVALTVFYLEATDPDGADLEFLESVALYVESPGLPRVLVASANEFPEGAARVDFVLEDLDLTDYVVSQSLTFQTEVTGHRPADDTTVKAVYRLSVGVTGQGACAFIEG